MSIQADAVPREDSIILSCKDELEEVRVTIELLRKILQPVLMQRPELPSDPEIGTAPVNQLQEIEYELRSVVKNLRSLTNDIKL